MNLLGQAGSVTYYWAGHDKFVQVTEITETEYFKQLQKKARELKSKTAE